MIDVAEPEPEPRDEPEVLYERTIEIAGWPGKAPKRVRARFVRGSGDQHMTIRVPKRMFLWPRGTTKCTFSGTFPPRSDPEG